MQDDEGHVFWFEEGKKKKEKKNAIILRTTGWLKLFMPLSASQVFSYSRPWCYLSLLLLVSGRINTPTRLNCVPGSTTAPFRSVVLAQNEAITLDLHDCNCGKYAKTACEGLHVNCKTASGDCDRQPGCSLFGNELSLNPTQGSVSTRLCVCFFLTLILPISNTSKNA